MDKTDLEAYQLQLSQAELALSSDPDNGDLASLRDELKSLIELTQTAIAQSEAAAASTSKETSRKNAQATQRQRLSAGDDCLARYSADGQWYPARITSVGGATENPVFSIVFKGYNTTELLKGLEIKPLPPNYKDPSTFNGGGAAGKRKLTKAEEDERDKKKKKNEKKLEVRAQKAKEQTIKQQSWQKFAKKSEKKGVHIAGVAGTSIFKTPDNPLGKGGRLSFPTFFGFLLESLFD
jgi:survival-of-motor-neuron-related-splicing factor 30